jgi:hypothetical protein
LSEFVPDDHSQQKQPEYACTRWNTTYLFPQAPSFVSKCINRNRIHCIHSGRIFTALLLLLFHQLLGRKRVERRRYQLC